MKRFLSLLGFFLFFISFVNAQNGKMSGKITESGTGKAVVNATVKIGTLNMSAVTDAEGFFEIKNIPYGKYTVTITGGSFESYETSVDVNSELVSIPDVEMKKKVSEGDGIAEISTIVLDQEDESKDQNISGLFAPAATMPTTGVCLSTAPT
jgi:hypothetical protein